MILNLEQLIEKVASIDFLLELLRFVNLLLNSLPCLYKLNMLG